MMFTKLLPIWAVFHLLSLCAASDILGVAQSAAPAVITTIPSSSDLAIMDSSTLTQPPNIATALPTAPPKTTSTTMVHGYMLLILPPEPVSYNTTNYTTSTMTVFSYSQPSSAPNVTYPSPKRVKDLAEIIVPSVLGGGAVVGGLSAWGIGWYLWKDFQLAMTDFPETNLENVAADFIEVAKAKSWEETVKREEQLQRYRRMGQLETFLIEQERKNRGTRFTRAQWSKFESVVAPGPVPFNAPPPVNCVIVCGEWVPRTHMPPPLPGGAKGPDTVPNTIPPRPRTSQQRTQSSKKDKTLTSRTRYPWQPTRTPSGTSDSKGKGKATARDTDTDYKSNWYSKTVDPDTVTTTAQRKTPKMPPGRPTPTQAPPSPTSLPSSHTTTASLSHTGSSSHHHKAPPPGWTEPPNNPPFPRPRCRGFNWHDCCIYVADLQLKCFPY